MIVRPSTSTTTIKKMGSSGDRRREAASSAFTAFMRSRLSRRKIYNSCEGDRIQTGAAHQDAVDLRLRHQALHVVGLHASSVKNADLARGLFAEMRAQFLADHAVRL